MSYSFPLLEVSWGLPRTLNLISHSSVDVLMAVRNIIDLSRAKAQSSMSSGNFVTPCFEKTLQLLSHVLVKFSLEETDKTCPGWNFRCPFHVNFQKVFLDCSAMAVSLTESKPVFEKRCDELLAN